MKSILIILPELLVSQGRAQAGAGAHPERRLDRATEPEALARAWLAGVNRCAL